ncbi:MAG: D-aminoacyl-tRNA deacylase [Planctomycetia bacterium]|nr:D-aminoacyl-tRNA deacylase [Planctomycetia bacterium]
MRACIQRVSSARVRVGDEICGEIGSGVLVLLGVAADDTELDRRLLADKMAGLRIFDDAEGKMNLSLEDVGGAVLVVSQFTLLADCRKGRRPGFTQAAEPQKGMNEYCAFVEYLRQKGLKVETGRFRAMMKVELINDGPVTIWLDSRELMKPRNGR